MLKLCLGSLLLTCALMAQSDEAAARVPLENYLKGHATGNGEFMKKAFFPDARMTYVNQGKLMVVPIGDYIARFSGKPPADEAQRKRHIESVKLTGNAGVGTIVLDYPDSKFVDYMTLLKVDGEWKIISKSFHREAKK